jgi:hypothetical protein
LENIQNIYDTNIKHILGGDLDYFRKFRADLIKSFILDKKLIQNNESTKHIDQNVLNNLNFNINNLTLNYQHLTNDKLDSSIIIKNGLEYNFINLDDKNFN